MPPKHLFCAKCGYEVFWTRRALPRMGIIFDLIEPHQCKEDVTLPEGVELPQPIKKAKPGNLDEVFAGFEFGKKLDELEPKTKPPMTEEGPGDRRPTSTKRDEIVSSTAPQGVLDQIKHGVNTGVGPEQPSPNIGMQSTELDEDEDDA